MIDKIIELFDKGYCNECNELNCLGGEPSSKAVANAIRELQEENIQLKEQLEQATKSTINSHKYASSTEDKLIDSWNISKAQKDYILKLEQENNYLNQTHDYDLQMIDRVKGNSVKVLQENRQLEEQFKQKKEVIDEVINICDTVLKHEPLEIKPNEDLLDYISMIKRTLQKYKGDNNE